MVKLLSLSVLGLFSVFLFSTKTEQSRVVTIQKPIVINQERKTPAYFAYQQSQQLTQKKNNTPAKASVYLGNLSTQERIPSLQISEMKITRNPTARDFLSGQRPQELSARARRELNRDLAGSVYDKVVFSSEEFGGSSSVQNDETTLSQTSGKWATVKGNFELRDGVGIVNHLIEIKRVEEGLVREQGQVNLKAGTYAIDISAPRGYLVAQIRDQNGLIIGEDRQKLENLKNKGTYMEGPYVKVRRPDSLIGYNPTKNYIGSSFGAVSNNPAPPAGNSRATANAVFEASLFNNQKTLQTSEEIFSNVQPLSSTIARLYDPSGVYSNVTTIRMTGDQGDTEKFTSKWLEGSIQYISDVQQIQFKSQTRPVLIGKILQNGQPVAGAQVQIETLFGAQPIYLDQFMIPSTNLTSTSTGGYFMFIGLEQGVYEVTAQTSSGAIASQLFIAEEGRIGFQNINISLSNKSHVVRVFDAFTANPVDADVVSALAPEPMQTVLGEVRFTSQIENSVTEYLIKNYDGLYANMYYVQSSAQTHTHIPLVQESWLSQIKGLRLINDNLNSGTIVGFVPKAEYEVYLAADNYDRNQIVYFNSAGEITARPEAGGGFILFNVPSGAQEVVVQELGSEKIHSQVFNVRAQQISAAHFFE